MCILNHFEECGTGSGTLYVPKFESHVTGIRVYNNSKVTAKTGIEVIMSYNNKPDRVHRYSELETLMVGAYESRIRESVEA